MYTIYSVVWNQVVHHQLDPLKLFSFDLNPKKRNNFNSWGLYSSTGEFKKLLFSKKRGEKRRKTGVTKWYIIKKSISSIIILHVSTQAPPLELAPIGVYVVATGIYFKSICSWPQVVSSRQFPFFFRGTPLADWSSSIIIGLEYGHKNCWSSCRQSPPIYRQWQVSTSGFGCDGRDNLVVEKTTTRTVY